MLIAAPAETVFRLAARVEEWPRILPHYHKVEVLAARPEGRIVTMAAVRRGIPVPVRWKALQSLDADGGRVRYRHIGGITRGMLVEWRLEPGPRGVEVLIVHDFSPPWPWPGPWIARAVVCDFFVHAIADQTLAAIKAAAEHPTTEGRRS